MAMDSGEAPPTSSSSALSFSVGRRRHYAVVTNRTEEAEDWVRTLIRLPRGTERVVGFSINWCGVNEPDGSVTRRVRTIHLSHMARVLVFYLHSPEEGLRCPLLMDFLADADIFLVGFGVLAVLAALGLPLRGGRRGLRGMDLWEVARVCGVSHVLAAELHGPASYPALVGAILEDVDAGSVLVSDLTRMEPLRWPLSDGEVELAVQTAVIAQTLGLRAVFRSLRSIEMI